MGWGDQPPSGLCFGVSTGCPQPSLILTPTVVWTPMRTEHPSICSFSFPISPERHLRRGRNSGREDINLFTSFQNTAKAGGGGGLKRREPGLGGGDSQGQNRLLAILPLKPQPLRTQAAVGLRSLSASTIGSSRVSWFSPFLSLFSVDKKPGRPTCDAHQLWDLRPSLHLCLSFFIIRHTQGHYVGDLAHTQFLPSCTLPR